MQPEGKLVKKIARLVEDKGGMQLKIHGGDNPFQRVGIPDLLCCYRGRFVGLEVKEPDNGPSSVQKMVLYEIVSSGGYASVVSSVKQVDHLLAIIDREVEVGPRSDAGSHVLRTDLLKRSIARHGG